MAKVDNLFDTAKKQLDSIAQLLETSYSDKKRFHRAINLLKRPQNLLKKKLIVKLTNGKKKVFQSFRIQYNDSNGPFMGGTRYSKNLSEEDLKAFAFLESIKSSLVDIPFGGAFGGIDVNPATISTKDLERLTKLYSQFLTSHIGTWKDVLTTDVGISEAVTPWMVDAYEKKKRFHSPATFVDNRLNLDGSVFILQEYLKINNISSRFRKLDIAILGFGNRAFTFATNLNAQNFRIVAVSDTTGGIVNSNGFKIDEVKNLKDKFTTLKEVSIMQKIEFINNENLLKLPVDILVIASKENAINLKNVSNINTKLILELTNFGLTTEAEEILIQKKIDILPDVILNSGLTILNHFDWIQKMHGYKWSREDLSKKLHTSTTKSFNEIKNVVVEKKISYRKAAYCLSVKRIIDAMIARGRV